MMTDTERILEIINTKKLSNVEFCSKTDISPATLSHIISGRSKPSLNILRSIANSFPDIDPLWLMLGTGVMYKNGGTETSQEGELLVPQNTPLHEASQSPSTPVDQGATGNDGFANNLNFDSAKVSHQPHGSTNQKGSQTYSSPAVNVPDLVREVVTQLQPSSRSQRRITEIRVFFDDGTYQSFGG